MLGGFALLGTLACIASVRALLNPPVLFEATSDGIVMYRDGAVVLARPYFIPWGRVESLEYLLQQGVDSEGDLRLRALARAKRFSTLNDATFSMGHPF